MSPAGYVMLLLEFEILFRRYIFKPKRLAQLRQRKSQQSQTISCFLSIHFSLKGGSCFSHSVVGRCRVKRLEIIKKNESPNKMCVYESSFSIFFFFLGGCFAVFCLLLVQRKRRIFYFVPF